MSLAKGMTVSLSFRPPGSQWWYGTVEDGSHGYLPSSHVCLEDPRGSTPTEAPTVDGGSFAPLQFEALFAYASEEEGDLAFEAGEVIQVFK